MISVEIIKKYYRPPKGFSLVELLVTVSIFSFIAVSVFVRNSEFNNSVLLSNLAYDIGLSIRQAQVYGLSVREFGSTGEFDLGYGVEFRDADRFGYTFFGDLDDDGVYDASGELVESYSIKKSNIIKDFCAETPDGAQHCANTNYITYLGITFKRPEPDAIIKTSLGGTYQRAIITIGASASSAEKQIIVESTGQISVQ